MEIKDRLKMIRKGFKLSQAEFGKRIQISSSQIGCYETGYRYIPERVINDICREFNVNKEWLVDGDGEMLSITEEDDILASALAEISLSDNEQLRHLAEKIVKLDEKYIDALNVLIDGMIKN